jgi:hypothetical protein
LFDGTTYSTYVEKEAEEEGRRRRRIEKVRKRSPVSAPLDEFGGL